MLERKAVQGVVQAVQRFRERLGRLGMKVDEDEPVPAVHRHRFQAEFGLVQAGELSLVGHVKEPPGLVVGPSVIVAHEAQPPAPLRAHQPVAAVHADVVKRADFAVAVADDDDRGADVGNVVGEVAVLPGELRNVPDIQPHAPENAFALQFEVVPGNARLNRHGFEPEQLIVLRVLPLVCLDVHAFPSRFPFSLPH